MFHKQHAGLGPGINLPKWAGSGTDEDVIGLGLKV